MSGVVSQPFQHFVSQVPVLRVMTIAVSGPNCDAGKLELKFELLCVSELWGLFSFSLSSCIATRMHFSVCRRCRCRCLQLQVVNGDGRPCDRRVL